MAFFAAVRAHKAALAGGASLVSAGVGMVSRLKTPANYLRISRVSPEKRTRAYWYGTTGTRTCACAGANTGLFGSGCLLFALPYHRAYNSYTLHADEKSFLL